MWAAQGEEGPNPAQNWLRFLQIGVGLGRGTSASSQGWMQPRGSHTTSQLLKNPQNHLICTDGVSKAQKPPGEPLTPGTPHGPLGQVPGASPQPRPPTGAPVLRAEHFRNPTSHQQNKMSGLQPLLAGALPGVGRDPRARGGALKTSSLPPSPRSQGWGFGGLQPHQGTGGGRGMMGWGEKEEEREEK